MCRPQTTIKEQVRLQFRAEFFNLLNHANYALPIATAFAQAPNGGGTPNPTFGKVLATATSCGSSILRQTPSLKKVVSGCAVNQDLSTSASRNRLGFVQVNIRPD